MTSGSIPQPAQSGTIPDANTDLFDLTELEALVIKETAKMTIQLDGMMEAYTSSKIIPKNFKKIFQNLIERCYTEISYLRQSNFSDRRQKTLRMEVESKLDLLRKEIVKLKKITNDIKSLNNGNKDHVCRDINNFYLQVGKRYA